MGGDEEAGSPDAISAHPRRAKALSVLSLVAVAVAAIVYLRPPSQPAPARTGPLTPATARSFQLDAVEFVTATTGWVLEDLDDFQFAVLGTTDGGRHWTPELLQASVQEGEYMRWFDERHGVVATVGGEPLLYLTDDGGAHWVRRIVYDVYTFGISASFVDPLHGWELVLNGPDVPGSPPALVRTSDGGKTWSRLGPAVPVAAEPFAVSFTDTRHGWLDTVSSAPLAYATDDGGATWRQVRLPAPAGGWPVPHGSYFVAVRATPGGGLVASVVNSQPASGRSGIQVIAYPPLTVRTYDGGAPVEYVYSTFADASTSAVIAPSGPGPLQAANQTVLRSVDGGSTWTVASAPSTDGTIGFAGPLDWWWVAADELSTTRDGGLTWSPIQIVNVPGPVAGSVVLPDLTHGWMGGVEKGVALLYTTSDGGADWTAVKLPALNL